MDDDPVPDEDEFPPLPSVPDSGAGAYYTGKLPPGVPPPGLPAHVYLGKGFPRAGFNSATYGGCEPWIAKGKGGRGRGGGKGGGPSASPSG